MTEQEKPARILLVEDDSALRTTLAEVLSAHEYDVAVSQDAESALRRLQRESVDLVITDLMMPGLGGEDLLLQVRTAFPHVPVVVITAFGSVEQAVKLTRAGAADYFTKPFRTQPLLESIARILDESRPQRELALSLDPNGSHLQGIVGRSRPMLELFQQIGRIARSSAPVLITGDTGTGKELIAMALHRASGRNPFVPVNCGAIPDHLLESELFGHIRGAFTGAESDKLGLFEAADGGTLFLDEIAELPLPLQTKLLRAVQSGEIRRVGETEPRHVQVRLLAATHRDLEARVKTGEFREDLYYRINVLRLEVPPLRERIIDVPLLAERHLALVAEREGRRPLRFSQGAISALVAHSWPGNVRELLNVVERAAIMVHSDTIGVDDLPESLRSALGREEPIQAAAERERTLAEMEREYILAVLRRVGGNRSRAAQVLGVPRRTLYRRLEEYGITSQP